MEGPSTARERGKMLEILRRTAGGDTNLEGLATLGSITSLEELEKREGERQLALERELEREMTSLLILSKKKEEEISLDDLTPEQRKRFLRSVADGSLGRETIHVWEPWWSLLRNVERKRHNHTHRPLVSSVQKNCSGDRSSGSSNCAGVAAAAAPPPITAALATAPPAPPPAAALAPTPAQARKEAEMVLSVAVGRAAPTLRFNILNVVLSYVAVERLYNGNCCPPPSEVPSGTTGTTGTTDTTDSTSDMEEDVNSSNNLDVQTIIRHSSDVARDLLLYADTMSNDARYESVQQVVDSFFVSWCGDDGVHGTPSVQPLSDLCDVLGSTCCIVECLDRVWHVLDRTLSEDKSERRRKKKRQRHEKRRAHAKKSSDNEANEDNEDNEDNEEISVAGGGVLLTPQLSDTARDGMKRARKKVEFMSIWAASSSLTLEMLALMKRNVNEEMIKLEDRIRQRGTKNPVVGSGGARLSGGRLIQEI